MVKAEDDSELVRQIRKGNSRALDALAERYLPQVVAFFRYMKVPDFMIEDLVQDSLIKAITKLDLYDENKKFSSWLLTVARNTFFDAKRRNVRLQEIIKTVEAEPEESVDLSPEIEIVDKYTVEELLKDLSSDEKLLIELRVFQELSFSEISSLTGEHETTLRSRLFRVLNRLRKK